MDFYVAKLSPAKPPLIIVHGWQGGAYFDGDSNTNGYHVSDDGDATNDIILYDGTNPSISTLSSLPESFLEDYQVWIAHLETSPSGTPHLEKNAKYLKEQIEYVYSQNPQDITIIAHSMGGVVSRAAIQGLNYVDSLYTLGSPHAGIPHLKNVYPELFDQFAMNDMDTSKINYFNQRNKNINGVNYYFIGGDASPFHPLSILFYGILGQKHDGLVGSYSSVGWVYPDKAFDPTGWIGTSFLGQYWTDETHSISYDEYINYYTTPPGDLHSFSVECIKALMKEGPINDLYCRDAKQGVASGQGITAQDLNSQTTLTFSSFTVLKTGQLTGSQSISVPLDIDSNSASLFYLTWNGATPTFTLTRPVDNVIVDQSYANSHPAEVVFETALGGGGFTSIRILQICKHSTRHMAT
ncbi:MAG: hypothetical protein QY328_14585 [Anaerolineales bacterium]|nr:MAG: hypothetical protein QY328_14585 [Anaerolineales bacterium]